jgi:mannose-6-phosphate isomerase-like protein (cupin superfamily)
MDYIDISDRLKENSPSREKLKRNHMADSSATGLQPYVGQCARIPWQEFPGHFRGALSKALVSRDLAGARQLDFRISHYQPMAWVEEHVHAVQEQVYFVLDGEGRLTLDGAEHLLRRHDYVWIPPGVRHSFVSCGLEPLIFLVLSSPATDVGTAVGS